MSGSFVGDGSIDDFVNTAVPALQGKTDPAAVDQYYQAASAKYKIPVAILKAQDQVESSGGQNQLSPAGAKGRAQLMDPTAKALGVQNPYDPEEAIDGQAKLLRQTLDSNGGNYVDALRQYQGGPDQSKWGAANTAYAPAVAAALKAQGGDPSILAQPDPYAAGGTKVAANAQGVTSDSAVGYTPPPAQTTAPEPLSLDDFVNGAVKDLGPAPAAPQEAAPPQQENLSPQQTQQLSGIIANPPLPDAATQLPPQAQPQAAAPQQIPGGPVPVALSPPPLVNGRAQAPQQSAPQTQGPAQSPPVQLASPPPIAAPQGNGFSSFSPSGPPVLAPPNVNGGWNGDQQWANAVSLGAAKPITAALGAGAAALQGQPLGATYTANMNAMNAAQQAYQAAHPGQAAVANTLGPIPAETAAVGGVGSVLGKVAGYLPEAAQATARFLGGLGGTTEGAAGGRVAAPGLGNAATNVASKGTAGALQGGAAGLLGAGVDPDNKQSVATQVANGVLAGSALGIGLGTVARTLLPAVNPDVAKMALEMKQLGVDLPTGQLAKGSIPGTIAGPGDSEALQQYMTAWNKVIGSPEVGKITSEGIDDAQAKAGSMIDLVANQVGLKTASDPGVRAGFVQGLHQIVTQAQQNLSPNANKEAYGSVMDGVQRLASYLGGSDVPGQQYISATQKGGWISNMQKNPNPIVAQYGNQIRQLVDNTLDASAGASNNQAAVSALKTARMQYGVATKLAPLADRAGASGIVNPLLIANKFAGSAPGTMPKVLADGGRFLPQPQANGAAKTGASILGHVVRSVLPAAMGVGGGFGMGDLAAGAGSAGAGLLAEKTLENRLNSPGYRNMILGGQGIAERYGVPNVLKAAPALGVNIYRYHNPLLGNPGNNPNESAAMPNNLQPQVPLGP